MIRINLLPQAKKQARAPSSGGGGGGALWAVAYMVSAVLWCAGLGVVYYIADGKLEEQQQKNAALEQRIQVLRKQSEKLDEVKAALKKSQELEEVVAELNRARTGPTRVLKELSQMLSSGGGPTVDPEELERLRRDNPLAGFNRSWDVRRLWLQSFKEDKGRCHIRGKGKTNEDVAEFLRRLALSEMFEEVTLERTQLAKDDKLGLSFIGFELTCQVKY